MRGGPPAQNPVRHAKRTCGAGAEMMSRPLRHLPWECHNSAGAWTRVSNPCLTGDESPVRVLPGS